MPSWLISSYRSRILGPAGGVFLIALSALLASAPAWAQQSTARPLPVLRQEIDRIDGEILKLLGERTGVVAEVGASKTVAGGPVFRPGRQASLIKVLIGRSGGVPSPQAIAAIWTNIIAASIRTQKPDFTVQVTQDAGPAGYGLAKDFFGAEIPVTVAGDPATAFSALVEGRADVVALPLAGGWWRSLPEGVTILASAPLVRAQPRPDLLILARQAPDPSGTDMTLVVMPEGDTPGTVLAREGGEMLVALGPELPVPLEARTLGRAAVPVPPGK
ncbi:chorismate mutase [Aquabacter sp. L1I39]|uniref:chorismate mutase n=1 Tax=Aquabacter sp. L1I39 TaxID=2820278 RepID=UPI001ADC2BAD|nr:chorismate mutase [Aquabacter sp. L1I39]QTL03356.1 chorismate mutase [Aquabacter sp. L1I39]